MLENLKIFLRIELPNYEEALELFNQRSKEGKNLILYEIHKSKIDGSIVKKVPVLNTSKHAERMRVLQEELKDSNPANNETVNASNLYTVIFRSKR